MHLVRTLVALSLLVTMLSPIQMFVAERPALAAPTACQPNEPNDENWQPGVSGEPQRCINGYKYTTRRRLKNVDGCLKSRPDALSHVYRHNKCGQGIEYIGQARAIRYLSDQLEPGLAGVTPDVQWEMQVGRDRLDILYYDRTMPAPNAAVQVIEAKVTTNNDYAQWPGQVDGYIDYLRNNGMTSVARGQILNYWGPYVDLFRVEDNKSKCESADGQPITNAASVIRTYRATSPEPGLLRIEEIEDLAECAEHPDPPQTLPRPGNQTEEPKPSWLERLREWFRLHRPSKVYGEPHLVTVDRLHYELQSVGEFLLADSDRYDMQIQARFTERRENVSIIDRTAMYVNEHVVELGNYQLRIDGELVSLASGDAVDLGAQAAVLRSGGSYYVLWDGPDGPMFQWDGACCHASLKMPRTSDSDLVGLLGNADGDPKNDLRLRDGTQLPVNASPAVLHESYADSWRVSNNESLFTYAPGQSTDTFTDLSFPQKIVNIHDLTPEQRSAGAAYCEEQQVPPGPQFNACVLDIALTSDESFAEMAAQQQEIVLDPQAATVDANGSLSVDFETSPLPENLLPTRVSSDPATSTFAGSFSGSGSYRFFVQSLPPHMNGTLAFDLITLGDWNSDDDTETVTVETDRGDPYVITPSELTPASSGTLASGVPFSVYRVQVPFEHAKSQIEFTFSGTGVDGVSGQGFGIDDIQLSMQVVPPQSFEATLPLSVSDGVPAAGAGNLETSISEDAYQFEVAQGGSIYIDIRSCAGGGNNLLWELRNAAGAKVASKGCEDGEVRGLAAGTYRLVVKPERESTGAYSLRVSTIPADVSATVTTDGQPSTLTVGDPGQNGTWTFTGTAGQRLYFGFSGGTFGSITQATVQVLKPDGKALSEARWCGRSCSFDTTALPVSGTYTIVLNPENTHTGALTARVNEVPADVSATVTTDGQPSTLTVGDPGQNGTWTFTGTAGQRLYFGFSGGTFGSITQATVQVLKPDGKALYGAAYCGTSCAFNTTILPVGGTYTIRLNPKDGHTGSLTAKVTDVPEDASDDTITIGGPASTLTTTSPGQNGTWLFTGTTGQRVYFNFTGGTYGNINYATVQVKSPDGSTLLDSKACGNHCAFNTTTLPLDGTYTIVLNPKDNYTGSLTARLYEVPGDISTTVTIGGPASTLTTTAPGQNGTWTFTGTTGQRVYFNFTGGTYGNITYATVQVFKPDGKALYSAAYCGTSCAFNTTTLPADGTYTIVLNPEDHYIGALTARLYEVPGDISTTVTIGGPASTLTTTAPGQNGTWTFTGTTGQRVYFNFTGGTYGNITYATVQVFKPDGKALYSAAYCGTSCAFNTTTLPADGTYTIVLNPEDHYIGALTARLYEVPGDTSTTVTIGGPASTLTTTAPGQNGTWTFTGTTGQRVYFNFTGGTYGSINYATVSIKKPDGTVLIDSTRCGTSCAFNTTTLPADGTYTITLNPDAHYTGALTAQLYDVPADATAEMTINGEAQRVTTTTPGQNATLTFAGTAGQTVTINLTSNTFGSTPFAVRGPDGATLASSLGSGNVTFSNLTLPADGTYTVFVNPDRTAIGGVSGMVTA